MEDPRETLVVALRMAEAEGIVDFNGHASLRLEHGRILINSGASVRNALTPADIITVDPDGRPVPGQAAPPQEVHIHTAIYRRRPDVRAVLHGHPHASTLLTSAGLAYVPVFAQGALLGRPPVFPSPLSINTAEAGAAVAATLADGPAILLRAHGAIITGGDIREAFVRAVYLEQNAARQIAAQPLGGAYAFSDEECAACVATLAKPSLFEKCWSYYRARLGA